MSNICKRPIVQKGRDFERIEPPLTRKKPEQKTHWRKYPLGKDPAHMAKVAQLPCCICEAFGELQRSRTQVHHCISGRYGTLRASDRCTIPLCEGHHQGLRDTSKLAIHQGKETWEAKYGPDYDHIAATLDATEAMG